MLEELELQIPNESLLYFSIGQVYKKLGEPHLELMNFAWAMDLDPKGSNSLIKQAIEKNFLPRDREVQHNISRVCKLPQLAFRFDYLVDIRSFQWMPTQLCIEQTTQFTTSFDKLFSFEKLNCI